MLIVIGDIHGCHDELQALLDAIGPDADDTIVSVGDLVDRGPEPIKVCSVLPRHREDSGRDGKS